jgi:hypothetical protein
MAADGDENGGGSGLPDIIGSATKVADISVMKDLLGRSFKAVGDYYGEQVEDFFNQRRAAAQECARSRNASRSGNRRAS